MILFKSCFGEKQERDTSSRLLAVLSVFRWCCLSKEGSSLYTPSLPLGGGDGEEAREEVIHERSLKTNSEQAVLCPFLKTCFKTEIMSYLQYTILTATTNI